MRRENMNFFFDYYHLNLSLDFSCKEARAPGGGRTLRRPIVEEAEMRRDRNRGGRLLGGVAAAAASIKILITTALSDLDRLIFSLIHREDLNKTNR